jgi:hypothetical protein
LLREQETMRALKEPERITLTEGLRLLEAHVPTEKAKARLQQAFVQKAIRQEPLFAVQYDEADIDWITGSVKIPRKRDRFCPTFSRAEFNAYFFALTQEEPLTDAVLAEIRTMLETTKAQLPAVTVSNTVKAEIDADIVQIEVEADRPTPRRRFMKLCLESLRDNLAKAAGTAAAALIVAVGGLLAKYFEVF